MSPNIIEGGIFEDSRGKVSFINDFDMANIRRCYMVEHLETSIIRAWQAHKVESKYLFVTKGSFLIGTVKIDRWNNPSKDLTCESYILDEKRSQVLHIPAGYANGFKALEPNSKMIIFSDKALEEANNDQIKFDHSLWFTW